MGDEAEIVPDTTIVDNLKDAKRELIHTDRFSLCDKALRVVDIMVSKQVSTISVGESFTPQEPLALSPNEEATYNAALAYLRGEFDAGWNVPEKTTTHLIVTRTHTTNE